MKSRSQIKSGDTVKITIRGSRDSEWLANVENVGRTHFDAVKVGCSKVINGYMVLSRFNQGDKERGVYWELA